MASAIAVEASGIPTPDLPPALGRVVERFVRAFAPEAIMLFGSYAKGSQHPGSDVDLLVVADVSGSFELHVRRAHQLAIGCFPPVDVVFATPAEVAEAANAPSPFLMSILGRGKVIYRRSYLL